MICRENASIAPIDPSVVAAVGCARAPIDRARVEHPCAYREPAKPVQPKAPQSALRAFDLGLDPCPGLGRPGIAV